MAGINGNAHISVPFEVAGIPEKREPPTVKTWGAIEFATQDGLISGKGFREIGTLDDREVTPRMHEKGKAEDSIEWGMKCPQPGFYKVSFTITAPYYGTREGQKFITVLPPKAPSGKPATAANTAGGDGGRVTANSGTTTTKVGTGATGTSPATGAATGSQPVDAPGAILIRSFGFTLGMQNGSIVISTVTPASFAADAGIQSGWRLKEVDGRSAAGMSLTDLKSLLAPSDKHSIILYFVTPAGKDAIFDLHPEQE